MSYQREYLPLTHPQQGIWYTSMMFPGSSISIVAGTARIKGVFDFNLLERAINLLIEKNDAFRTRIVYLDGQVKQYISEYNYRKIDYLDFSKYDNPNNELFKWDEEQTQKPFDLYDSDLAYFAMLKINQQETAFYAKTHHIISDAWTMSLVVNEILELYSVIKKGEYVPWDKFPSYSDFVLSEIEYKNSDKFIKDQEYWIGRFNPLPEITALKTRSTNEKHTSSKRKTILAPLKFTEKLREYCKENGISAYPLFIAALAMYINRVTAKDDIVIGTPVLNRSNKKEKNIAGMFINVLPIRVLVDSNKDFKTFSDNVQIECMGLLRHQRYPYDLLLKDIRAKYNNSDNLYDIVLSYQNSKMEKYATEDQFVTRWHFNHHQVNSLTIHINDRDDEGRLIIDYDFHDDLYHVKEIEFLHNHMLSLLWHALDNPRKNINKIEMLPESEKNKVLYEFNNTSSDYPNDKTIHQLFEDQVQKTPDNIALVFEGKSITYEELNYKSNQLADVLRKKGVKPEGIIALMMNRSFNVIIGMLGILKAGCAFLPIDPEYPEDRIKLMLDDSNSIMVLTQNSLIHKIITNIDVFGIDELISDQSKSANPQNFNRPRDLAYVIYTSGSTGIPKGVMIEHRNLINFIYGIRKIMDYSVGTTVLSMTTISFDIFIFEIIPSLVNGLKVIIASREEQMSPMMLIDLISKNKINKILGTPSRIMSLVNSETDNSIESVKEIMVGGDLFPIKLLEGLKKVTNAKIFNGYGPTETTVGVTFKELTDSSKINIGCPIQNTRIYILDQYLNPVPIGIPGDLYIAGDGVGRGYINRPKEMLSKFITSPFSSSEVIYHSGDIARWYPRGEIEFLGRIDHQVKIKGLRIELNEIENRITKIEGIQKAVVTVREDNNENKALCAYYVASKDFPSAEIRKQLSMHLPNYMVPSFYVRVDFLPYNSNGKLDINSLPKINTDELAIKQYVAPRNEIEKKLADALKKVLNLKDVGIDNSFFELGGDSLTVIMLQVKLLEYKWNLKTQDFYKYTTIRELSEKITGLLSEEHTEGNIRLLNTGNKAKYDIDINYTKSDYNKVLLLGSTGFLGIHILDSLLSRTNCEVYCLVRGSDTNKSRRRLNEALEFYFSNKYKDIIDKRLFVISGDITETKFGLAKTEYSKLGKITDAVVHSAALVKYYGEYSEFEKVNVMGTENVADFALDNDIPLFYISTLGLSGQYFTGFPKENFIFTENDLFGDDVYKHNVYIRSKYEAEKLINTYVTSGLKASIFRVGNLTGRFSDGLFQRNIDENSFYNIIRSLLCIGAVSKNIIEKEFNFTPVDLCSRAITELVLIKESLGKTFHIFNNNILNVSELLKLFTQIGINIVSMETSSFQKMISEIAYDTENNVKLNGLVNELNKEYQLDFGTNIKINSDFTTRQLEKLGFRWPRIDADYIKKIYNYIKKINFLN